MSLQGSWKGDESSRPVQPGGGGDLQRRFERPHAGDRTGGTRCALRGARRDVLADRRRLRREHTGDDASTVDRSTRTEVLPSGCRETSGSSASLQRRPPYSTPFPQGFLSLVVVRKSPASRLPIRAKYPRFRRVRRGFSDSPSGQGTQQNQDALTCRAVRVARTLPRGAQCPMRRRWCCLRGARATSAGAHGREHPADPRVGTRGRLERR